MTAPRPTLTLHRADLGRGVLASVRIADGRITAIAGHGERLGAAPGADEFDAAGAALLPGLHDHHIHLLAYAAALGSLQCGPPQQHSGHTLAASLRQAAAAAASGGVVGAGGWLRGIGYHESVAGDIDRDWLDAVVPAWPLRIQHRSGQLWILNSCALAALGVADDGGADPFERRAGRLTGRLFAADGWLRERLAAVLPDLDAASRALARRGVTGVTDAGPANGRPEFEHFAAEQARGHLRQQVLMMGGAQLDGVTSREGLRVGPTKLYLREAALPDFDALCDDIRRSHGAGRAVAVHCVTLAELVLALQALRECGVHNGDRIEHASLCSAQALELLREAGVRVVTQPHFVFERGDAYLAEAGAGSSAGTSAGLSAEEIGWLYRGRSFVDAGIALAAGSDAPYGDADPWAAMAAAVHRRSRGGQLLGGGERLWPLQALGLFGGDALRPGQGLAALTVGSRADLCVADRPWRDMLNELAAVQIRLTLCQGEPIWSA